MKQEDRLLVALALTIGILFLWTVLFPAPSPQQRMETARATAQQVGAIKPQLTNPRETTEELQVGDLKMGVGSIRGGILSLEADGTRMLVNAEPGLLSIRLVKPVSQEVELSTQKQADALLSESRNLDGLKVTRTIAPSDEGPFFSTVAVAVVNVSARAQTCQVQILGYHPVYSATLADRRYENGFVSIGGKVHKIRSSATASTVFSGTPSWITAQGRSHTLIVQPMPPIGMFHVEQAPGGAALGWIELPPQVLAPGEEKRWVFRVYSGPLLLSVLRKAGLEEAFSMGLFSGIAKLLLGILLWSEGWLRSYGWSVIFLSVLIWIVFFPVTWSGLRMMKVMGQIQPKLAKIQKEHKNNPQKLNQEMMAIYREHRVNPLSGCLPMLLQMPIFLALYQVLQRSPQLRGAAFYGIRDLSAPDAIIRFHGPVPIFGESVNILPLVMAAAMFLQQRFTSAFQKPVTDEQAAQQQVFKFMPILFCFLFYSLPSGLVLYWVTNTVLTLAQYTAFSKAYKSS